MGTNDNLFTVNTSEQCMDDDPTLLKTIYSKNDLPLATKPDVTQPNIVTKRDIQSKEKKQHMQFLTKKLQYILIMNQKIFKVTSCTIRGTKKVF